MKWLVVALQKMAVVNGYIDIDFVFDDKYNSTMLMPMRGWLVLNKAHEGLL